MVDCIYSQSDCWMYAFGESKCNPAFSLFVSAYTTSYNKHCVLLGYAIFEWNALVPCNL